MKTNGLKQKVDTLKCMCNHDTLLNELEEERARNEALEREYKEMKIKYIRLSDLTSMTGCYIGLVNMALNYFRMGETKIDEATEQKRQYEFDEIEGLMLLLLSYLVDLDGNAKNI